MNWLLYAILGAIFAGLSPVLAKSGMHKSNSHLAAALRGTFLFLSALFMVNRTGATTQIGATSFIYLIFSGIATGMVWVCLLRALQLGEVIKVVPIVEGSIILNILVGIIFFNDSVSWNTIIILILLIMGTFMMGTRASGRGSRKGAWLGYAIGAMVLTTVTVVLDRIGIYGVNGYYERMIRYAVAAILVWLVVFATRGYKGLRSMSFLDGVYLCLSGCAMGASWYCFLQADLMGINANVDMVERFDLVAAVVLGCVFLRERSSVRAIFGMLFMMIGFWMLLANLPIIPL